jgi:chemotaxis response regulator CheB
MVKRILGDEPKIVVLGEAANLQGSNRKAAKLKPDILLLDFHRPDNQTLLPPVISTFNLNIISSWASLEAPKATADRKRYETCGVLL